MKNYKLHTSEGVRDLLGSEASKSLDVLNKLNDLYIKNGFEYVKTPTFEYIDVYNMNELTQQPSLYNLINRQGEVLALRNDMTASIRRIVASNKELVIPHKFCYSASTFRYPRLYQGKSHEFMQSGIEIVGDKTNKASLICLRLACLSLIVNDILDFTIHISSSMFLIQLFKDLNIDTNNIEKLKELLLNNNHVDLLNHLKKLEIENKYINLISKIILSAGKVNFLNSIIKELEDKSCVKTLYDLLDLYNEFSKFGIKNEVVFDFSISSYAKYYTGFVFQIYASNIPSSLLDGGLCDNLFSEFNLDYSIVGFGINVDLLTTYLINYKKSNELKKYLIHYDDVSMVKALKYADKLRDENIIVSESLFDSSDVDKYSCLYDKVIIFKDNKIVG